MIKMKKILVLMFALLMMGTVVRGQTPLKKVYDETVEPMAQIDRAVAEAAGSGKYVVCQVGGNWCPWCLRFAAFIESDTTIARLIADRFVYIHVNYVPRKAGSTASADAAERLMKRLGNPRRFGFPVLVVLDGKGNVIHLQDSSYLEDGQGYSREKVERFFRNWSPEAVENLRL